MSITIASIETSIGSLFHKAAGDLTKIETAVQSVVGDVDKAAPIITAVAAAVSPAAGGAAAAAIAILNAVDAAVTAAGTAAAGGVTVSLPAELVTAFNAAKTAILADVKAL